MMSRQAGEEWRSLNRWWKRIPSTGLSIDLSGMGMESLEPWKKPLEQAMASMTELEAGSLANPDEGRRVGHYWLRAPHLAPDEGIRSQILGVQPLVDALVERWLDELRPEWVLHLGIGGSALGPELLADALPGHGPIPASHYLVLDNSDSETFQAALGRVDLARTAVLVVSKSGRTPETRNALLRVRQACDSRSLPFAPRAAAITGADSVLHEMARSQRWAGILPLWSWVGGRTSLTGPVGLLPAALLGLDGRAFLEGAAAMDQATRLPPEHNPAAWLAAAWARAQAGRHRHMVLLPYCDRLRYLGRYMQQLVMESLGKRRDRAGVNVRTGLTVFGNKGSTDQHAYVQQLRDGPDDFFATFVQVLAPSSPDPVLHRGTTAWDTLQALLLGTRNALADDGKLSLTLVLDRLVPRSLGALIALFERAVGIYAEMLNVNAYNQPGVEAGKKAASRALELQAELLNALDHRPRGAQELSRVVGAHDPALCWRILTRLAGSPGRGVGMVSADTPGGCRFYRAREDVALDRQDGVQRP